MSRRSQKKSGGANRGNLTAGSWPGRPGKKPRAARKRSSVGSRRHNFAASEREPATPQYLARLFARHEYTVSSAELERFWKYYCLLRRWNQEFALTSILGIEATVLKHFIDSALVADLTELSGPVLDIGSGAGFPGAVIAIRRPQLPVVLAESRGKRASFLARVQQELGLVNVTIHDRSIRADSAITAGCVITRALEAIPATLGRVRRLLPAGGRAVFMKGPNCGAEITRAQQDFKGVYKMIMDRRYTLPQTKQQRRLVVFERRK